MSAPLRNLRAFCGLKCITAQDPEPREDAQRRAFTAIATGSHGVRVIVEKSFSTLNRIEEFL